MSELDKMIGELEAKREQKERPRRKHHEQATSFLANFYATDLAPSSYLIKHSITANIVDNRIVLHRPSAGHFDEPFMIVVGEQGEIDAGGKSFGTYDDASEAKIKRALIDEIISHFDL